MQGSTGSPDAKITYTSEQAFVDIITGRMSIVNAYFKQKFAVSNPCTPHLVHSMYNHPHCAGRRQHQAAGKADQGDGGN